VKKGEAEAFKRSRTWLQQQARTQMRKDLAGGWSFAWIPKFEVEDADLEPAGADDLDAARAEALERGGRRELEGERISDWFVVRWCSESGDAS
jgi:hypothetical protein